ncbi:transcription activator, effector binding protein [Chitinispirillum alkaliphilum]|nr:transcription activator, effector binding protein [Chitinispirillum alkaliphilum]
MEIRDVKEQKALAVNLTTPFSELPNVIGKVYGEIMEYMGRKEIPIKGFPYVLYHNMDMDNLKIDIGWQIDQDDEGEGRIKQTVIPAGKVVYAMHTGPYSTLEKTYNEVMDYMEKEGIKTEEWMYEVYLNSPENTPEDQLKTEIHFPVKSEK